MASRVARVRSSVSSFVETATETAETARQRSATVDTAFAVWERDRRAVGGVLAGAVAFRVFVYLLPLVLAVISVLGILASFDASAAGEFGDDLGMSDYLIDSVDTAAEQSQRSLWVLVPIALWATYWGGVGLVKVLRAIHSLAWNQPVRRLRGGWSAAAAAFGFMVAVIAIAAVAQAVRERSESLGIGFSMVQVVILVVLWWVVTRALPHDPEAAWLPLLPGAVLVGVGAWVLHMASVHVLARRVASASDLYGSLGVAAALLLWLYLLGRLVTTAAMVNATLWERRAGRRGLVARTPDQPLTPDRQSRPGGSPDHRTPTFEPPELPSPSA